MTTADVRLARAAEDVFCEPIMNDDNMVPPVAGEVGQARRLAGASFRCDHLRSRSRKVRRATV